MRWGRSAPEDGGFLPVYSVDSEQEARLLCVMCCPKNHANEFYARELAEAQTFDGLARFSDRLAEAHERLRSCRQPKE